MQKKVYTFIDLFAGTSALSEGFSRCGFSPIAHVEMNQDACYTIKTRLSYHYLKEHDQLSSYNDYLLGRITRDELYSLVPNEVIDSVINEEISDNTIDFIFKQIRTLLKQNKRRTVDFIIGGPPCQAYSLLSRHSKGIEKDERCFLYLQYGKFLREYNPKGFVFENVIGLLSAKNDHYNNIKEHFNSLGYKVYCSILNAADYGVVQNRRRVIIYGWREDYDKGCPVLDTVNNPYTCEDVFCDLQPIDAGQTGHKYILPPNEYLQESGIRTENDILTEHIARPINNIDIEKYRLALNKLFIEGKQIKSTDFPIGLRTIKNTNAFLDRFKVVARSGKSQTIVAHLNKDGHHFIYPSLQTIRSISVREAARLQSFPDNFYFEGSRGSMFKQIGNAVPPLMAYAIARKIKELL